MNPEFKDRPKALIPSNIVNPFEFLITDHIDVAEIK